VPGVLDLHYKTYESVPLDAMPPIGRPFDGTLRWLRDTRTHDRSLQRGPDDYPERDADAAELEALSPRLPLPPAFRLFIEDPTLRRHIRSATSCYLDLAQFVVGVSDGGVLIHFLSDQQSVLEWLLYVGPDGSEAVLVSLEHLGFDYGEGEESEPRRLIDLSNQPPALYVCSESFEEFLYRFWVENELFHRLAIDKTPLQALPDELRSYAEAYPRNATQPSTP